MQEENSSCRKENDEMKEYFLNYEGRDYSSLIGNEKIVNQIRQHIETARKQSCECSSNILAIIGVAGSGKTYILKHMRKNYKQFGNFLHINCSELIVRMRSVNLGSFQYILNSLIDGVPNPVVVLDEIDCWVTDMKSSLREFMNKNPQVPVIALFLKTQKIEEMLELIDKIVQIEMPTMKLKRLFLENQIKSKQGLKCLDLRLIAEITYCYTFSDLLMMIQSISMWPLKQVAKKLDLNTITSTEFEEFAKKVRINKKCLNQHILKLSISNSEQDIKKLHQNIQILRQRLINLKAQ